LARLSLIDRPLTGVFAQQGGRTISVQDFLQDVAQLTGHLPDATHLFNLVQDRYHFTVAFAAIAASGRCNVLPPNGNPAVQARLARQLPSAAVLHDGLETAPELEALTYPDLAASAAPVAGNPVIDDGQPAMIAFTSGSSGDSKPVAKTLRMLRGAARLYEERLIPQQASVVETVPPQHMYGLELASLQAFWSPIRFTAGKPMFPAEVAAELEQVPAPRVLVTTPLHLRALVESQLPFPRIERILSATAPLDPALAAAAEQMLAAPVLDVYGCSEAGCIALRRLAKLTEWSPFPGLHFTSNDKAVTTVNGPHFDEPVPLADRIRFSGAGRFVLDGRIGDLINVAGKRGSLGEITRLMQATAGVSDAVAFMPAAESERQRPAALYAGTASVKALRRALARDLDPVFIPRPMVRVERLPRADNGKLPLDAVLDCFHQQRQRL